MIHASEADEIPVSPFLEAKKKIEDALKRFQEEGIPIERFPRHLFEGCQICCLTEEEMGSLFKSLSLLRSTASSIQKHNDTFPDC